MDPDNPYLTSDDEDVGPTPAGSRTAAGGVRKRVRTRETVSLVRGRSSSRPSYKVPPKTHLRTRSDTTCMASDIHLVDRRDLSPSEVVRAYLARADESVSSKHNQFKHVLGGF